MSPPQTEIAVAVGLLIFIMFPLATAFHAAQRDHPGPGSPHVRDYIRWSRPAGGNADDPESERQDMIKWYYPVTCTSIGRHSQPSSFLSTCPKLGKGGKC
jgi:hypothetical protein